MLGFIAGYLIGRSGPKRIQVEPVRSHPNDLMVTLVRAAAKELEKPTKDELETITRAAMRQLVWMGIVTVAAFAVLLPVFHAGFSLDTADPAVSMAPFFHAFGWLFASLVAINLCLLVPATARMRALGRRLGNARVA